MQNQRESDSTSLDADSCCAMKRSGYTDIIPLFTLV